MKLLAYIVIALLFAAVLLSIHFHWH